jgi:uncharacterized repeat protein (TIGR03847 family)
MPRIDLDLKPVDHVTVDAFGKPGERTFYLQGTRGDQSVTLLVEKIQLQSLSVGITQFLSEVLEKYPDRTVEQAAPFEEQMHITPPVDPLFRVGEVGLAYAADEDLGILLIREILSDQATLEEVNTVRFWCTRQQLSILAQWIINIASRGRPVCPQCGEPMEPEGHLCPKKNGHRK